jgi:DNA-binding CsgD family transcriptional regulator/regulator of extracellular matrix RemA (YlzA/DUF370 family)
MRLSKRSALLDPVFTAPARSDARQIEIATKRERMKLIIVNDEGHVLLDSIDPSDVELRLLLSDDRKTFRDEIAQIVQPLIDDCATAGGGDGRVAFLNALQFVRVTRLDGRVGSMFAVSVENVRGGDSLSRSARKYQLTPREIDVLALILEGASAYETGKALSIAETTVQGYYKRLLSKTRSRNRAAMVANVLDWNGSRSGSSFA